MLRFGAALRIGLGGAREADAVAEAAVAAAFKAVCGPELADTGLAGMLRERASSRDLSARFAVVEPAGPGLEVLLVDQQLWGVAVDMASQWAPPPELSAALDAFAVFLRGEHCSS